jgi:hypothetical protein
MPSGAGAAQLARDGRPEGLRYERNARQPRVTAWRSEPSIGKSCVGGVVASGRETSRAHAKLVNASASAPRQAPPIRPLERRR